uniref:Uncharacterized protein n=1 Tax=Vombatus ursinus TaxID=29139 RepID=A0A4X2LR13_VOMUR
MDDKGYPSNDDTSKAIKPPSQEFRKTQGFRRTAVAEHEGTGDAETESLDRQPQQQQQNLSVCRSGRQPKHTERAEEFLTTVRKRGGKKDSSEPASCSATDVETASEGSVESTPETKTGQKSDSKNVTGQPTAVTKGRKDDDTSKSDSDGLTSKGLENHLKRKREQEPSELTLKGIQNCPRKKRREEDPTETVDVEAGNTVETEVPSKQQPETVDQVAVPQESKEDQDSKLEAKAPQGIKDEEPEELAKWKPECDVCDPDPLCCLCQQPHNRFMICYDLLEEWFPGDYEGISEACGELWEGNGEDCICPDFTFLQAQDETTLESDQQETKFRHENADGTELPSIGTIEEKSSEDQGIKGRTEKATNSNGKSKLKIFQPVIETPGATKCIGPGCSSMAQPDSVYCSDDCILKHAEATMKFLSAGKEPKPKVQGKPELKPEECSPPKSGVQAGIKISSVQKRPAPDKEENIAKKTMVTTPWNEGLVKETTSENSISSWVLDHNYNAVKPEETAAISSSLSYKCMYHTGICLINPLRSVLNSHPVLACPGFGSLIMFLFCS